MSSTLTSASRNRPRRHYRDPAAAAELLRHLADQPDRRCAGGIRRDIEIRASVLAAQGKAFCAGANFNDPARQEAEAREKSDPASSLGQINHLYIQAVRIFRNKKPIVAAVHGAAIGGGLGLAVSADFRVTCPEARFAANFTKLGFHPGFGLTATLPELVGKNNAELIFYTSRRVTGEEATRMGLANVCVPQDQVRAEAMKLAPRSPNARRSACSRRAPPCAPASPTACWPPPTTNSSNKPGCAPPRISRKASRPPPNAAPRISGGGNFTGSPVVARPAQAAFRDAPRGEPSSTAIVVMGPAFARDERPRMTGRNSSVTQLASASRGQIKRHAARAQNACPRRRSPLPRRHRAPLRHRGPETSGRS